MNLDFADNTIYHMHNVHLFNSDQPTAHPSGDDGGDDDQEDDDDNAVAPNSDDDPAIDKKIVHSPLPTDDGGKPKK